MILQQLRNCNHEDAVNPSNISLHTTAMRQYQQLAVIKFKKLVDSI